MRDFVKKWLLPPGVSNLVGKALYPGAKAEGQELSEEDKRLLLLTMALKDRHSSDERCFVLGAGSSLKKQDLRKLAGEHVISVSNSFVHPDFPAIRPGYHVLPYLLRGHGMLHSEEKFIKWLREMEENTFQAEMFFHIGDRTMIEKNGLFKGRAVHWVDYRDPDGTFDAEIDLSRIPAIWSVSELAITIAIFLGFKKIYLIGIDHDWFNGLFVYFYDEKTQHALQPDKKGLEHVDAEYQMRRHAEIFKRYKYLYDFKRNIFNANADPNHYLDVFPKVDYDSLFIGKIAD